MQSVRIGLLLGLRQIQRASRWTTGLIIFVMMLTFLNLVAVSGILVGLIEGAVRAVKEQSLGDIVITPLDHEDRILETERIEAELNTIPEIVSYSIRYRASAELEANYRERRDLRGERDTANVNITGIDPLREDALTKLSTYVREGEYLNPAEQGYILIGKYYLDRYAEQFGSVFDSLSNVYPGDTVRLTIGDTSKEFIVKGIVDTKVDEVSLNTYIPEKEFRRLFNRLDHGADQIVAKIEPGVQPSRVQDILISLGQNRLAKIETFEQAQPKFITDIKNTFDVLGTFIGSIGIVVGSITIFIIVFINALSRRRQIGILKAIGIERRAIELAYVVQAAFYSFTGSVCGVVLTFFVLVPYFDANPINFPFSDGILLVDPLGTAIRFVVLFVITLFAGLIPAWLIARQNTLNAILGR
jgi:ABC-type lipoprotein release transport system permease subunit